MRHLSLATTVTILGLPPTAIAAALAFAQVPPDQAQANWPKWAQWAVGVVPGLELVQSTVLVLCTFSLALVYLRGLRPILSRLAGLETACSETTERATVPSQAVGFEVVFPVVGVSTRPDGKALLLLGASSRALSLRDRVVVFSTLSGPMEPAGLFEVTGVRAGQYEIEIVDLWASLWMGLLVDRYERGSAVANPGIAIPAPKGGIAHG